MRIHNPHYLYNSKTKTYEFKKNSNPLTQHKTVINRRKTGSATTENIKDKNLHYPAAFNYLHFQDHLIVADHSIKNFKKALSLGSIKKRLLVSRNEAMMLEYMIMLSRHYFNKGYPNFYHSNKRICRDTGFSVATVKKILLRFEIKLKILSSWIGGKKISGTTIYQLNYKRLYLLLPALFISDKKSHPLAEPEHLERYKDRYNHFVHMHEEQQKLLKQSGADKDRKSVV